MWVGYDQPQTIRRNGYAAELAVPMWTRFMKAATKGQKAAWIDRPRGAIRDARVNPPPAPEYRRWRVQADAELETEAEDRAPAAAEEARLLVEDLRAGRLRRARRN